ncbi:MAG: hypothetical protein DDT19_02493 [Syntrophomonadaceae bacterium]|nr:hypothetical protein [Bacillota bacterium]
MVNWTCPHCGFAMCSLNDIRKVRKVQFMRCLICDGTFLNEYFKEKKEGEESGRLQGKIQSRKR